VTLPLYLRLRPNQYVETPICLSRLVSCAFNSLG
jgi:hypothetical protein